MEEGDKEFWREHPKEMVGISAIGLAGLAVALAVRRSRARNPHQQETEGADSQEEDQEDIPED